MKRKILNMLCSIGIHWNVEEGGGAHFGDDLLTCTNCNKQKYPESFSGLIVNLERDQNELSCM